MTDPPPSLPDPPFRSELGERLPAVARPLHGPRTLALIEVLASHECPGLTSRRRRREELSGSPHDPIVYREARGANVLDVDGNRYVDLVGGFGAALLGHSHPRVVTAVQSQAARLLHALGDVYPSEEKLRLEEALAGLAPWPARVILGLSGADAVEAALKTARLATGRSGVVAFHGGYHGLSYGTLAACGYKDAFRAPFAGQLNPAVRFAPYPDGAEVSAERALNSVETLLNTGEVGAVLVEPILGRGGVTVPPTGFLPALGALTRRAGTLLIADEIYTGLGRCGGMFRSVDEGLTPDLVCLGKSLGAGLPVSACLIREDIAQHWARSAGEALHTSTFLGNPLACAAALASLDLLTAPETRAQIAETSTTLRRALAGIPGVCVSGAGLLVGVGMKGGHPRALAVLRALLERGYITLLGGAAGDALTLTPPMCLTAEQCEGFAAALGDVLDAVPA